MNHGGYIVWVNDEHYWHPTLESAQRRLNSARLHGKDTFIYRLLKRRPSNRPPSGLQVA
jgi:hypothetical protein